MSKVRYSNIYKLKKSASIPDFLTAFENLIKDHISKQKGFVSAEIGVDDESWGDCVVFETMDDVKNFLAEAEKPNDLALAFYAFLVPSSCKTNVFTVEKSYTE